MSGVRAPAAGWDALPGTLKWVVGISWFHVLMSLVFGLSLLSTGPGFGVLSLAFAGLWSVVAVGLVRGASWAWGLGLAVSVIGTIAELAQGRIGVSTNLVVAVLLLTPSGRGFLDPAPRPGAPRTAVAQRVCSACGAALLPGRDTCSACGHEHDPPLARSSSPEGSEGATMPCPRCTSEVKEGDAVCWWCGLALSP